MTTILRDHVRPVSGFVNLDAALRDRQLRGQCVLFDLHGLWWSVPMELTVHEISDAIAVELVKFDVPALPSHLGEIFSPKIA